MLEIIIISFAVLCAVGAIVGLVFFLRSVYAKKGQSEPAPPEPAAAPEPVVEQKNYYETLSDEVEMTKVLNAGHELNNAGFPIRLKNLKSSRSASLTVCPELVIGRMEIDGIFTIHDDPAVSKRHCRLFIDDSGLLLEDLNSSNHTYLNGEQITSPVPIRSGDEIRVGNTRLMVFY